MVAKLPLIKKISCTNLILISNLKLLTFILKHEKYEKIDFFCILKVTENFGRDPHTDPNRGQPKNAGSCGSGSWSPTLIVPSVSNGNRKKYLVKQTYFLFIIGILKATEEKSRIRNQIHNLVYRSEDPHPYRLCWWAFRMHQTALSCSGSSTFSQQTTRTCLIVSDFYRIRNHRPQKKYTDPNSATIFEKSFWIKSI